MPRFGSRMVLEKRQPCGRLLQEKDGLRRGDRGSFGGQYRRDFGVQSGRGRMPGNGILWHGCFTRRGRTCGWRSDGGSRDCDRRVDVRGILRRALLREKCARDGQDCNNRNSSFHVISLLRMYVEAPFSTLQRTIYQCTKSDPILQCLKIERIFSTIGKLPKGHMRGWRNWQTHYLEVVAPARAWRFESSPAHKQEKRRSSRASFFLP